MTIPMMMPDGTVKDVEAEEAKRIGKYTRISADPSGLRFGVGTQSEEIDRHRWARWPVAEVFDFEDDDTSGFKEGTPRPAFDKMMAMAERGELDYIIARHLDRLTRRPEEWLIIEKRARAAGCEIILCAEGIDTSTDVGRMIAGILSNIARFEMERKKYRTMTANKRRAEGAGREDADGNPCAKGWGPRAFGYNGDHNNPALVDKEAAAIQEAYHDILAGDTLYSITKRWNTAGFRTGKGGKGWTRQQVRRVLMNPRNAGLRAYQGEIVYVDGKAVRGDWPPVIDEKTWEAVHYMLANRPPPGSNARKYLLGSILVCGVCGAPLAGGIKKVSANVGRLPVYRCKSPGGCVVRRQWRIDPYVEAQVLNRIAEKGWKLISDVDPDEMEALHNEAIVLRSRRDSLGVELALGNLTGGQVRAATEVLDTRLREAEAKLSQVAQSEVFDGLIGADDLEDVWDNELNLARKRAAIRALIDSIEVFPLGNLGRAASKVPAGTGLTIHWHQAENG